MKSHRLSIALTVFLAVNISVLTAAASLKDFGDVEGRSFHSALYEDDKCTACHGSTDPTGLPTDEVCLDCHGLEDVVAATTRAAADEVWQNPHNNMHWGKDVPCMECHGEHAARKPLCQGCHSFKYDSFHE